MQLLRTRVKRLENAFNSIILWKTDGKEMTDRERLIQANWENKELKKEIDRLKVALEIHELNKYMEVDNDC